MWEWIQFIAMRWIGIFFGFYLSARSTPWKFRKRLQDEPKQIFDDVYRTAAAEFSQKNFANRYLFPNEKTIDFHHITGGMVQRSLTWRSLIQRSLYKQADKINAL